MSYRINDRFTLRRDTYGWELVEYWTTKPKTREPSIASRSTWHATISQACESVLDRMAGDCETAEQLQQVMAQAVAEIREVFQEPEVQNGDR